MSGEPESAGVALLLVDFINDLDFAEGPRLLAQALPVADAVAGLKRRARDAGWAVIYVNDNFGHWRANFPDVVAFCSAQGKTGAPLVRRLLPEPADYFVLKPRHSGFFGTTLETLLRHLGVRQLVVTGVATDVCVLFTANDAYMRGYGLWVPEDCVAAVDPADHAYMLAYMRRVLKVDTRPSRAFAEAAGDLAGRAPG